MGRMSMVDPRDAYKGRDTAMEVDEMHFVLGNPMKGPWPEGLESIVLANGCFWGSEKGMWRLPGGGIYSTAVGYVGGFTPNPTYREVCSGMTGHTEAVLVVFDPAKIALADILRWFWQSHDPTQYMGQGNDRGTQYRSAAYYANEAQKHLIEASKKAYGAALVAAGHAEPIVTEVAEASTFYYAEAHHQQYLARPGARPYCSAQPLGVQLTPFALWATEEVAAQAPKLPEAFWDIHAPSPHCVIRSPHAPIDESTYLKADVAPPAAAAAAAAAPPTPGQPASQPSVEGTAPRPASAGGFFSRMRRFFLPPASSAASSSHQEAAVNGSDFAPTPPVPSPVAGDESIMAPKAHGTSKHGVQGNLRWECDVKTADHICNFNRHYAENAGYFLSTKFVRDIHRAEREGERNFDFFDSNSGRRLFTAPVRRSYVKFLDESRRHGWPSFRDAEVNWDQVRILPNGECVSIDGTHLGHNLPDEHGNRYCINLVSVAGYPDA